MSFSGRRARRGALAVVVLSLAVLGAACVPNPSAAPPPQAASGGPVGGIINALNGARAQAGLPGFAVDGGLNGTAQHHANRLASGGGGCGNLWHSGELGSWGASGETVACLSPCTGNGGQFVSMWLNSPPHRAIVLDGGLHAVGVGAACSGGAMYAVAQFR